MRLGLICRSEDRGLGSLSRDYYQNLHPDKTLVVIPAGVRRHGLESHLDWYPDATVARYDGQFNERLCREWLEDLDVILMFETAYDWRFCTWAAQARVATVCMAMPEYWRSTWARFPTRWWAPTSWRLDLLPPDTRLVPVPVPTFPVLAAEPRSGSFRWLHVGGARLPDENAHADRNGTNAVIQAARLVREPQEILVRTQSPLDPQDGITVVHETVENRWDIYADADAVVLPRRYAGLSLPVLEAFAAGLPVVMTDMSPQNVDWPIQTVLTVPGRPHRLFGTHFSTGDADPAALAQLMDRWATDPTEVAAWRDKARGYADRTSWEHGAPAIRAELEEAADLVAA